MTFDEHLHEQPVMFIKQVESASQRIGGLNFARQIDAGVQFGRLVEYGDGRSGRAPLSELTNYEMPRYRGQVRSRVRHLTAFALHRFEDAQERFRRNVVSVRSWGAVSADYTEDVRVQTGEERIQRFGIAGAGLFQQSAEFLVGFAGCHIRAN
ncbi:MAG TPA: hypothetical protein VF520_15015 [Thermoleophilaceae bacterium]